MRLNLSKRQSLFLLALLLSLLSGCGAAGGRGPAIGERFNLTPNETVSIKETPLAIELKGVRRTWYVDGKSETADADLIMTLDGREQRQWLKVGEETNVGDYTVKVWGADPFGKTSVTLVVTRR
ncbi:MAG TPA: hypothetical protein VGC87_22135 [Pyrinomonadaceae bacterium]|jgi:hypothetical protein